VIGLPQRSKHEKTISFTAPPGETSFAVSCVHGKRLVVPVDDEGVGEQKRGLGGGISLELDDSFLGTAFEPVKRDCTEKHEIPPLFINPSIRLLNGSLRTCEESWS
jgi:hypothetical protein